MTSNPKAIAASVAVLLLGAIAVCSVDLHALSADLRKIESGARWTDASSPVPVDSSDAVWGKRSAPVTVVVFGELSCPYTAQLEPVLERIRAAYGRDKVRMVWKNLPQQFHRHAQSAAVAGEAVRAVSGLEAFLQFRRLAFKQQTTLTPENTARLAEEVGVAPGAFARAVASDDCRHKVEEDVALARSLGLTSTPAVLVNGITMQGAQVFERYAEAIDAELKKADELLARGVLPTRLYVELSRGNLLPASATAPVASASARTQATEDTTTWKVALGESPSLGPAEAPVTMVVFGDFQCPHSRRASELFRQLAGLYGPKLRIVWKDRPLALHPHAMQAASFAREARKQKGDAGFWSAHDKLFENNTRLELTDLLAYASTLGLDVTKMRAALESEEHAEAMQADLDQGDLLRANATPHVFINGRRVLGAPGLDGYKQAIGVQLAKAEALVRSGVAPERVYEHVMSTATEPPPAPPPEKRLVEAPGSNNPWRGGADARVIVQVFADYQCTHSKRAQETLAQIEQHYGDKIRIVWRHRPLPIHPGATLASEAAQEIFAQKGNNAFWRYHRLLFDNQLAPGGHDPSALERYAAQVGADVPRFNASLQNHSRRSVVEADAKAAVAARILSTPTFMVNGYYLAGAVQPRDLRRLIDRAMREAL